jgi:hypothetical protein
MYIVICVPSLVKIAPGVPELCWKYIDNIYIIYIYIYSHVHQIWLKWLQAFQSYAGTYTHTSICIRFYIYRLYIIYIVFIYIAICVPSLVEIAPGFPELCWNIHTHMHPF